MIKRQTAAAKGLSLLPLLLYSFVRDNCSLVEGGLIYDKTCCAWPNEVLVQDGVTHGACMSYAYSFQFLCQQAGIPCILAVSDIHEWNMVYAEGRWWEADISACDVDGVTFQTNGAVESEIAFDGTDEFRERFYVTADGCCGTG